MWACSDTADVYVFASQLTDDSSPAEAKFTSLIENPKNLVKLDKSIFWPYFMDTIMKHNNMKTVGQQRLVAMQTD